MFLTVILLLRNDGVTGVSKSWIHDRLDPIRPRLLQSGRATHETRGIRDRKARFVAKTATLGGKMERLAAEDFRTALEEAGKLDGAERVEALGGVLRIWIQTAPQAALTEVRGWRDDSLRLAVLEQACRMLALEDPHAAISLALDFPSDRKLDFLDVVVHAWAESKPSDAAAWADERPAGEQRERLQSSVAVEWAQHSPASAASYVATSFEPGYSQDSVAITVALCWADKDPAGAAEWILALPESDLRSGMLQGVLSYWSTRDEGGARNWAAGLPEGDFRQLAFRCLNPS